MGAIAGVARSYKRESIIRILHIYLTNSSLLINLSPAIFCQWRKPRITV